MYSKLTCTISHKKDTYWPKVCHPFKKLPCNEILLDGMPNSIKEPRIKFACIIIKNNPHLTVKCEQLHALST